MGRRNEGSYEYYELLRSQARDAVNQGNLEQALALCDRTIAWAEEHGDQDSVHREYCNRSSILVNQGRGEGIMSKLRQILLGSSNPEICYQAANNISRFHEMRDEAERGLFYARLSLDHAKRTKKQAPVARSYNQIGLFLVRDSYFQEAGDCFASALDLLPVEPTHDRAIILHNLGYCQTMLGNSSRGFSYLFRSLRISKQHGADILEMYPRLGLSFAYLEIDRPRRATVHARRGLLLAEQAEIHWQLKNALYLLGESEKLSGNELAARRTFTRLQQEFYPDDPVIPDFLMVTDVRKMINLMA